MNNSKLKSVYFITGASGVGKTTLIASLKKKYAHKDWIFLHFDSIGVPSAEEMVEQFGSGSNWQKAMTFQWIDKILTEYRGCEYVFLEGQVNLEFIKEGFKKHGFEGYHIILIDCDEATMEHRLTNERNQPELFHQDMKNWLKFLRNQANELNVPIINTSKLSTQEGINEFEQLVGIF